MVVHLQREYNGKIYCGSSTGVDRFVSLAEMSDFYTKELCPRCLSLVRQERGDQQEGINAVLEERQENKPNRYTILQNNQGWWQVLKRNKENTYWVVEVPNCGSRRSAVLMLNALIHATVEGTPEELINRAYSEKGVNGGSEKVE